VLHLLINILDEILLSSDKTVAVIDGSGVLADPAGLDRTELVRLAKARKMISNFDKSKLSKDGYVVLCEQHDVKLPCEHQSIWSTELLLTLMIVQLERSLPMVPISGIMLT
jgi:NAD-specific glutamate dehydrogenase